MSLQIRFSDRPLGHEILGINTAGDIAADVFAEIEAAYDRYGVILFRNQHLTPEQQIAFSKRFGDLTEYTVKQYNMADHPEIFIVSNVVVDGKPLGMVDAGRYWHTDMWVTANPPRGSMLYAIEVPIDSNGEARGDTCFASTAAAYDGLPEDLRKTIEGRRAVFDSEAYFMSRMSRTPKDPITGDYSEDVKKRMTQRSQNVVQHHDMVKVHPRTGRKSIYFSEEAISHIEGMSVEESAEVLEAVRAHVLRPEYVYRHRWAVGDLVMWDNISCLHKAIGDFDLPLHRTMHRTTLASLVPNKAAA
jgi:taurine dioxygenase